VLTYHLLPIAPPVMRFYRNTVLIDLKTLLSVLPREGRLLDVGCGTGLLDYEIARKRKRLTTVGIDIDERAVSLAKRYNSRPNVTYEALPLQEITDRFDCVSFVDVMHHASEPVAQELLSCAARMLLPGGYVLVKDIRRDGGWFSYAHDRYITRSDVIRLVNPDEMRALIPPELEVTDHFEKYRFPFPNYYFKLVPAASGGATTSEAEPGPAVGGTG
jgi:SAM-dependent methyltransferase